MTDVALTLAGEQVYLLSERVFFWPGAATIVVADLHWGKPAPLPTSGVPVPFATTSDDLGRLDSALRRTEARRLVVLGDLFHTKASHIPSHTLAELRRWRSLSNSVEILLVRSNHDRHSGDPPNDLRVNAPAFVPPFVFRHEPVSSTDAYGLAGHVHPGLTLVGRGLQRETLPCFIVGKNAALLPAFGSFTTLGVVEPGPGDRAFVIASDEVLEVTAPVDLDPTAFPTNLHEMSHTDPH
jgi:DNA ligase-associated metallophosphoesterase